MKQLKVIWLSNKVQSSQDAGNTGTWLDAMAHALVQTGQVGLANIALGPVYRTTRQDVGPVAQWVVPASAQAHLRDGLPTTAIIDDICNAVEEFKPDVMHIWGTENFWGLLPARGLFEVPSLLEMQGLVGVYARVFSGALTWREQVACIGPKELIQRFSIFQGRKKFARWGSIEKEIIRGHSFITNQSGWIDAWVKSISTSCKTFHNDLLLRPPFYCDISWHSLEKPVIFCSAAYPVPYKGLHVAIRAIALLKHQFPDIQLRIAGAHQRQGIRQDGYIRWLNRHIKKLGVENNVVWLGRLTATQIINEMRQASAMVLPTFIENCCTAMQEAMMVGIPLVVTYTGGLPSIAKDEETALFFPIGDEAMCAYQIERLLTDKKLAKRLSKDSREVAKVRNDPNKIVNHQLEIYRQVINKAKAGKISKSC